MHACSGVNLMSLLFMNVYRIFIFIVCLSLSLCWWVNKKGEKNLESLYMHAYDFCLCIYVCLVYEPLLNILIIYCYAWIKGDLLWSLYLIHAYITPWVLSSSKRGRLLTQRPITLVLMMINSCSYSTNDLVFI